MPTKVSIGLTKKAGLPDFGSVGASCHVELELDGHVLDGDQERFRHHVRRAYSACEQAIEEELSRARAAQRWNGRPANNASTNGATAESATSEGHPALDRPNSSPQSNRRNATQSQIRAIKAIAGRRRLDVSALLGRLGVSAVEQLGIQQASELIDELKGQTATSGGSR